MALGTRKKRSDETVFARRNDRHNISIGYRTRRTYIPSVIIINTVSRRDLYAISAVTCGGVLCSACTRMPDGVRSGTGGKEESSPRAQYTTYARMHFGSRCLQPLQKYCIPVRAHAQVFYTCMFCPINAYLVENVKKIKKGYVRTSIMKSDFYYICRIARRVGFV